MLNFPNLKRGQARALCRRIDLCIDACESWSDLTRAAIQANADG